MQKTLATGEILYEKGSSDACAYLISTGEIGLYADQAGTGALIEKRGIGAMIGDTAVLLQRPRSITARALAPTTVYEIPSERLLRSFERIDPILQGCITSTFRFIQENPDPSRIRATNPCVVSGKFSQLLDQLHLEEDLAHGLTADEFHVVFQPIMELGNGTVAGFETLMRWTHPVRGTIRPDIFIAAAEDMGMIWQITQLALSKACETLRRCRELTENRMFASVNISARDVGRAEFVEFLIHTLDRNSLVPADIKLELTETAILPKTPVAKDNLERMRTLGFGISVDDFGTGYSNLGYLQILPINTLKIDRMFSNGAHANSVAQSIVRTLIALGRELDVEIVAEGVEDLADVQTLENLGCRFVQGFYFHKPMEEAALLGLLENPDAGSVKPSNVDVA